MLPSRIFLDDASPETWADLLPTGIFHGVTTNPLILQKAKVKCEVSSISKLVFRALEEYPIREVMCHSWGGSADSLEANAAKLLDASGAQSLVIKLPLTKAGITAAHRLRGRDDGIRLCMTACYSRTQAIAAAALGVAYLAPYLGRMTERFGKDGLLECLAMQEALSNMRAPTRLLVESLRDASTLFEVVKAGADGAFSAEVARQLLYVVETEAAAHEFEIVACGEETTCLVDTIITAHSSSADY
ncbi:hypothetical protein CTAYLR_009531 [Chrysophaeum taylorii]|uniref:Transaldolase n=1 Tax=Chrysophaeum taylorii TaxID=2483200 RepID=A0AAD7UHX1_9STRA|nr:hypothetical protein CTAYLR_009531 [Chrysophaeum taylorii]